MPWSNQSGGGGWKGGSGGGGPWGQGPQGGGPRSPELEEFLKRSQDKLKQALPGGGGIPGPVLFFGALALAAVIGFYMFTASINSGEIGVVTRFGKYIPERLMTPGLHWRLPPGIENVDIVQFTAVRVTPVGMTGSLNRGGRSLPRESLMLTGDENIVDLEFQVQWSVTDAAAFLFNIQNPEVTVKEVAESAMREVIGQRDIVSIITKDRPMIATSVKALMQDTLDRYKAGVLIKEIQLQKTDPPEPVIEAFNDVQKAQTDQETMRNEATAYANKVVPEARGEAERILQGAQAYKEKVVADANGQTSRFTRIYEEYKKAPEVTRRRMFLETMEQVLGGMDKVIIDNKAGGNGVVPYINLQELSRSKKPEGGQ